MLRRLLMVALLWAPSSGWALDPDRLLTQYDRRSWTTEDGLPQSSVLAIAQTPDGFLWLATLEGVVRFDGIRFETVQPASGLPAGWASMLAVDVEGQLWVVGPEGLYRRQDEHFEAVRLNGVRVRAVHLLLPRVGGGMWVSTEGSTVWSVDGRGSGRELLDEMGQPLGDVNAGATDGRRVCLAAEAIYCFDDEASDSPPVAQRVDDGFPVVRSLVFDHQGALWAGTGGGGLYVWPRADRPDAYLGRRERLGPVDGQILALAVDRAGTVWFGNSPRDLGRIDRRRGIDAASLPVGLVRSLFEDRAGNLWVGTNTAGLVRMSDRSTVVFSTLEGLPRPSILCVIETDDGILWLGVEGGGLVAIVDGVVVGRYGAEHGLPDLDVRSLARDGEGRLLLGSARGVFVGPRDAMDAITTGKVRFTLLAEAERPVFALHLDRSGVLWVGVFGGLGRLGPAGFESVAWGGTDSIVAIAETPDGTLWFGGEGGLLRLRAGQPEKIGDDEPGPNGTVLSMVGDAGGLWVGNLNTGLGRLSDDGSYRELGKAKGLCDDMVFTTLDDRAGRLWMSSNRGVFAVEKAAALATLDALNDDTIRVPCKLMTRADGLRNSEANGGLQPSAWRGRDGRLWFATIDGVAGIDPGAMAPRAPPTVVVDRIEVADRVLEGSKLRQPLALAPVERDFAITYTALDLTHPESLQFRYRLRGFKDAWVEAGERRTAYFTQRAPGRHVFEVAARVADGPWSQPTSLSIELAPRFHETPWFWVLMVVALLTTLTGGYRWRIAGIRRRQTALEQAVVARTADLEQARAALENANVTLEARVEQGVEALRRRDRMAAYGRLVAGVAHELRHPIFSLQTVAHLLRGKLAGRDTVRPELELLGHETTRIKRLLDDLLELARSPSPALVATDITSLLRDVTASHESARAARDRASIPVELVVDAPLPTVNAEREKLVHVLLNLLDNAVRHARGATKIVLAAGSTVPEGAEVPWLRLTVSDDGAGVDDALRASLFEPFVSGAGGTGLGLAVARTTIESHGGTIRLVPAAQEPVTQGAVVEIMLPPAGTP